MPTTQVDTKTVEALLQRAHTGMLISAACPGMVRDAFDFWKGSANAMATLLRGGGVHMAARDAQLGGYQPPRFLRAAVIALGDDINQLTRTEIEQRLVQAGFKLPLQAMPLDDVEAATLLIDGAVATVDLDKEHAILRVDSDDSAGLHGAPLGVETCIVKQGNPTISAREQSLINALKAIVTETMAYPADVPQSADSYLPEDMILAGIGALGGYGVTLARRREIS